jgi:hypothetical protein
MLTHPAHRQPTNDHRRFNVIVRLLELRGLDRPEQKAAAVCARHQLLLRFRPGAWTHPALPIADEIIRDIELLAGIRGDAPDPE